MRNVQIFICSLFAGATLTALSISAAAQPPRGAGSPGGRALGCTVYRDANYQGPRDFARDGDAPAFVGAAWNDQISSLRCDEGCTFDAFENAEFAGLRERFRGDVAFVGPAWNDRISAYRVTCRRGGYGRPWRAAAACTFYEHANFAGRREEAGEDEVAFVGPEWNDQISSIQCRPGCAVEGFADANYAGPRQRFEGNVGFVGPFWNDKISSFRVTCRR